MPTVLNARKRHLPKRSIPRWFKRYLPHNVLIAIEKANKFLKNLNPADFSQTAKFGGAFNPRMCSAFHTFSMHFSVVICSRRFTGVAIYHRRSVFSSGAWPAKLVDPG